MLPSLFSVKINFEAFYLTWQVILKGSQAVLLEYQQILVLLKAVCILLPFVPCHESAQACLGTVEEYF